MKTKHLQYVLWAVTKKKKVEMRSDKEMWLALTLVATSKQHTQRTQFYKWSVSGQIAFCVVCNAPTWFWERKMCVLERDGISGSAASISVLSLTVHEEQDTVSRGRRLRDKEYHIITFNFSNGSI